MRLVVNELLSLTGDDGAGARCIDSGPRHIRTATSQSLRVRPTKDKMLVSSITHLSSSALSQDLSRERFPPLYLLIVEGDGRLRWHLKKIAKERNFIVSEAKDIATAREMMKRQAVDLLLLDPSLRGDRRESFFEEIKALHPETDVIVSTASKDLPLAMEAIKNGAVDYVTSPLDYTLVSKVLDRSRQQLYAAIRSRRARERFRGQKGIGGLVGQSSAMQQLRRLIAKQVNL